jgi:HSP20 family molecular chaperone IbpA
MRFLKSVRSRAAWTDGSQQTQTSKGFISEKEQCSKQIFRAIDLPKEVDSSKVTATLKDGVLELSMPKAAKAQKVPIEEKPA